MMYLAYTFGISVIFSYNWLFSILICLIYNSIILTILKFHFTQVPHNFIATYLMALSVLFLCIVMGEKERRSMYLIIKRTQELEMKQRDILNFIPDPLVKVRL